MLLLDGFERYIEENELFTHDDKILLTVSGGVDSMVMMALTAAAGYKFGVAHCNFQLRGKESDEDEVLVEHEAKRLGVEFFNKRFDTVAEMEEAYLICYLGEGIKAYVPLDEDYMVKNGNQYTIHLRGKSVTITVGR